MKIDRKATLAAIIAFILYWPIMFIGIGYAHSLAWKGGTKTLLEKIAIFIFKSLYIMPESLFINGLIWSVITYTITTFILIRKRKNTKK